MAAMQCTSCGAPIEIQNRFSKVVVCSYCNTHHRVLDNGLDPTGKHPKLAEYPSLLSVGCAGTILGKPFRALGRLRYGYDGGFWDEWFLDYDGGTAWLAEDEGTCTLYMEKIDAMQFPDIQGIRAGQTIMIDDRKVMVKEKGKATIKGGEGELLYEATPGSGVSYIDGIWEGKKVSIEYTDDELEFFAGRPLLRKDIVLQG